MSCTAFRRFFIIHMIAHSIINIVIVLFFFKLPSVTSHSHVDNSNIVIYTCTGYKCHVLNLACTCFQDTQECIREPVLPCIIYASQCDCDGEGREWGGGGEKTKEQEREEEWEGTGGEREERTPHPPALHLQHRFTTNAMGKSSPCSLTLLRWIEFMFTLVHCAYKEDAFIFDVFYLFVLTYFSQEELTYKMCIWISI